jgi:transposase
VLRCRRAVCAGCGARRGLQIHDRRVKRWRHLDLGGCRCIIECELRRVRCAGCRCLGLEAVAWARPDAPYTRDFDDLAAWLAQQMNKTQITRLLRIGWASDGEIVAAVRSELRSGTRIAWLANAGGTAECGSSTARGNAVCGRTACAVWAGREETYR